MMPFREPVWKKEKTELVGVTFEKKKTTKIEQLKSTLELILP